jgi:hypothetical protein
LNLIVFRLALSALIGLIGKIPAQAGTFVLLGLLILIGAKDCLRLVGLS